MRVMIKDGDLFDLREQSLVDLLHVGTGQWTRLTRSHRRQSTNRQQQQRLNPSPHEDSALS
jgi:hypothetical protein